MIEGSCGAPGKARFDPFCLQYIVSYLSGTARLAAGFIGTPMEWSAKQCQTDQPFGSWADDLANAFVQLEPCKIAEHPFQGTIFRIDATPIRISRVTATKHRVLAAAFAHRAQHGRPVLH